MSFQLPASNCQKNQKRKPAGRGLFFIDLCFYDNKLGGVNRTFLEDLYLPLFLIFGSGL